MAGYDYYFPLAQLNIAAFNEEFVTAPHSYAPLVHLITAGVFLVFGASRVTGIAVNLISLAALLLSVSWIGRTLYSNPDGDTGVDSRQGSLALSVLAPLLATSYHFAAWLHHDAFLDYPLMAMVSVSFATLIRADRFQIRGPSLIFGLSLALGMLTKQTFLFFMFLPALYVSIRVIAARNGKAILNLALAGLVAIAVAAVWYGPHLDDVIEIYQVNKLAAINENEAPLFSFRSNLFYPHALLSTQMQLPFGLLFLAGLIYSFARRGRRSLLLYLWLFGGIGAFTLVANKDPRYTVPVLPAAALISVSLFAGSRAKADGKERRLAKIGAAMKPAVVAGAAAWALVSFFNAQWPRDGMGYYIDTPDFRWMVFARNYFALDHHPAPAEWAVPDIVQERCRRLAAHTDDLFATRVPARPVTSRWRCGQSALLEPFQYRALCTADDPRARVASIVQGRLGRSRICPRSHSTLSLYRGAHGVGSCRVGYSHGTLHRRHDSDQPRPLRCSSKVSDSNRRCRSSPLQEKGG